MIPGISGRLVSASFIADALPDLAGVADVPPEVAREVARRNALRTGSLGPASSVRAVADIGTIPILELLGYHLVARRDEPERCTLMVNGDTASIPVVVTRWSSSLDAAWRSAVHTGISADARWCACANGRAVRIIDTHQAWARRHIEFDLAAVAHVPETLRVFWTLARAESVLGRDALLERAAELSAKHAVSVCRALADGVLEALGCVIHALAEGEPRGHRLPLNALLEQSLTALYRVLFLLFAEARGLVPVWHPIYRDRYTIDAIITALVSGRRYRGVWQALRAIGRIAHAGCRAGDLRVTAFNGRLFSPAHAPSVERGRIDDETIGRALLAVGTTHVRGAGRARIRYRDLDVEQLGAVYEQVLDYEAARDERGVTLRRTGDARKASGTFYTPRAVAAYLVRQTLTPLVRDRTAPEILALRVVDPAMGSGAFLVAAGRFLAGAAEFALLRDGEWDAGDVTAEDRLLLQREIAQRCLFGADLNPMAVQLARLSIWLATLAGDRPLTFLDHHLVTGDSLVGASIADVISRPPGTRSRGRVTRSLPLFDAAALSLAIREASATRTRIADERDDDVEVVKRKEAALLSLARSDSVFTKWKALHDLWCACWFGEGGSMAGAAVYHALSDELLRGRAALPPHLLREWQQRVAAIASRRRFLHWELEFPEVFFDRQGARAPEGGFDAVLGNPPWDMVRGDSGPGPARAERRLEARQLIDFARGSGIYLSGAQSHVNRFQLFVERALQIARPGGRIGLVLPSGLVSDTGSAPLRRHLFETAAVDRVVGLDNRAGIFPIHRSVRFVLLTATTGRPTDRIACRFGISDPDRLDAIDPEQDGGKPLGAESPSPPVELSRSFLARLSGEDSLAMPELLTPLDVQIVDKISSLHRWLSSSRGWHARFGRELNASDDRGAFVPVTGAPTARLVLEGKHIAPFRVALGACTWELSPEAARKRVPRYARLAYRDVASATNRLTLIAAIVPARTVTTHTLFCLRTPMSLDRQHVLCALMNSFVANYLVRMRVNTHVTTAITSRLPIPFVAEESPAAMELAELAKRLSIADRSVESMAEYVELQAIVARLYRLTAREFEHVLTTFPLIPTQVRADVLRAFGDL